MTNDDKIKTFIGAIELHYMAAKRAFEETAITANKELFIGYCMDKVTESCNGLSKLVGEDTSTEVCVFIMRLVDVKMEFYLQQEQKEQ